MTESNKEGHMNTITKLLLVPAIVVAFSVGVALAASGGSGGGSAAQAPSTTDGTTTLDTTTTGTTTTGVDISGPCDEAEHRNDPRCTGAGSDDREDNSGPGSGRDDDRDDDREDNSGPGSGDDNDNDDDDDRSGSNSGRG
jgi:hypothetical protein